MLFLYTLPSLLICFAPLASAFPTAILKAAARDPTILKRAAEIAKLLEKRQTGADAATKIFEPVNTFNAQAQYINVTNGSGHEYVAPGPDDLRGPCPGLNAFANHKQPCRLRADVLQYFLPHDGYASVTQYIDATTKVVGMGPILSIFLSALGGALDGDILNWSMGGTPSLTQGGVTGVLGNGLIGSHNKYEGDASPTRPDLYQSGNNYKTVTSQFQELIDYSPGGEVTLDSLTSFRSHRFDTQISQNSEFFNGPFSGVLVQPAAAAHPAGQLTHDVVQSWFGVQGSNKNYNAVQGTERIPDNWYRRAIEYPYDTEYFLADAVNAAALHPKFLDIGGNTGTTNSFVGVDVANLTGGVFNTADLLKDNNFACFVYQLSAQAKPDAILGVLDQLTNAIGNIIGKLGCPQLQAIDTAQLKLFPGYS
ncbi:Cloroperoxidase [Karstenula rhodostoma CBS 690.94]|uniref:Cloroperoxidase n=1 Tax=Karstenula rhodostoma CBS 690.94 TaxID=1392251 RepID=A0A9P4UE15_9PLEO|nr:Cloroperoxidase [Karstenula rhodostoma CBS 690.94]